MEKVKLGPQTLLFPMPAVLVGSQVDEKPTFMTAAWCAIASFRPTAVSVAMQRKRYTLIGVNEQETFSVNIPSADLAQAVDYCGLHSGKKSDKSQIFEVFYGVLETAPLIQECPLNLECKKIHALELGSHTLVVGEVVETYINEGCLTDGKADPEKIDPLVYSPGAQNYHRLGEVIARAFHVGKEIPKE